MGSMGGNVGPGPNMGNPNMGNPMMGNGGNFYNFKDCDQKFQIAYFQLI